MGKYGIIKTQVWVPENKISKKMFDRKGMKHPMKLSYLDIPYMYTQTERGMDFIYALAHDEEDVVDVRLFGL